MAFGGGEFNSSNNMPMSEINMTPLVDVMLVLLIIFIVCAPLMTQAIKVDLPQVSAAPVDQKPETINLAIKADGQTFWNSEPVSDAQLKNRLESSSQQQPQPEVHMSADKDVRYEKVAQVMGAARDAGIAKFGFVTAPGGQH
ncbi:MAG TPA: biopolymer transporter ExbD [Rhodocyclaceae bacterium]|nr:biopolymer transporter ExbD [Rhodocyclaceae bacterium]